uniref:Uncharacterized protein LOC101242369 n=1 Tax=Phallusia mammillata TaxID=59560 RepID=A0A6F9DJE2_9ASCI|nr:uncharacterized protein LOC101242369 [Phallusia mammillata]
MMECVMMAKDVEIAKKLVSEVVTSQLAEQRDLKMTKQLASQCLIPPVKGTKYKGLALDIKNLLEHCQTSESGFDFLHKKADLSTIGLHYTANLNTAAKSGVSLSTTLHTICCAKEEQLGAIDNSYLNSNALTSENLHIKRTIESYLVQLKETSQPELNKHIFAPTMMEFYASEVVKLKAVIELVTTDLTLCLSIMKGETEVTYKHEELINKIIPDQLPSSWQHDYSQLFRFHRTNSLSQFVTDLDQRVTTLHRYMDIATQAVPNITPTPGSNESMHSRSRCSSATQTILSYNLAVFTRPDLFLQSVLFTVAKSKFHDPNKYIFSKQFVMGSASDDRENHSTPPLPFGKIFIDGLYLHKATYDRRTGMLQESRSTKLCKMPLLQLTAQKLSTFKKSEKTEEAMFKWPVWLCNNSNPDMFSTSDIITEAPMLVDNPKAQWETIGTSLLCKLD